DDHLLGFARAQIGGLQNRVKSNVTHWCFHVVGNCRKAAILLYNAYMTIVNDTRIWPDPGVSRVPYRVYADPEIYAQEQQKLFRGPTWNFLAMASEIPNPGDFRPTDIGATPVIVVRGKDGGINALVNRCAHRGNLVCITRAGNAEQLSCVYHNWTYDLAGKLTSVAFRRGVNN